MENLQEQQDPQTLASKKNSSENINQQSTGQTRKIIQSNDDKNLSSDEDKSAQYLPVRTVWAYRYENGFGPVNEPNITENLTKIDKKEQIQSRKEFRKTNEAFTKGENRKGQNKHTSHFNTSGTWRKIWQKETGI